MGGHLTAGKWLQNLIAKAANITKRQVLTVGNEIAVTLEQIRIMKHAIGFKRESVKRGKYVAYRNYYAAGGREENWDALVSMGLATHRASKEEWSDCYHVSAAGIGLLAKVLAVKIVED